MSGAFGRVLVVDDNKVIRQLIKVNLELEGFEVVTASDGAECLEVVHRVRPDVITLDVVMPRLDGLSAVARLRDDPRTCRLPVAIVSACTQGEVESGLAAGVDAFLSKPFEPAELVRLVRRLAGQEDDPPSDDGGYGAGHGTVFRGGYEAGRSGRYDAGHARCGRADPRLHPVPGRPPAS
ncbi:CheY-like chemotaxis protein [Streptomyces candidus]|uniref:CheY-like chemotaxis protein n=1 Tax=Streptomyces candidus TaxID=67283 RepID=A0A7X0HH60_9ACTN|nr:response regulator [Streptomyces candidus]MBB6437575.1 CheY-like chemotaxis protein [Streptomyces candidus]GHH53764.1 response regulator [Streptomyces candidus]